jgi:hypothetical protein
MLEKKLLTVAGVIGILACGACFLPPIKNTPNYPPPPLRDSLKGIRTIDLFLDDSSDSHQVNRIKAAALLCNNIDSRKDQTRIHCDFRDTPRPKDAVLRITLVKESATAHLPDSSQAAPRWVLALTINATLTGPDGQILWQEQNVTYNDSESIETNDPATAWESARVLDWLGGGFSDKLLGAMFYGN